MWYVCITPEGQRHFSAYTLTAILTEDEQWTFSVDSARAFKSIDGALLARDALREKWTGYRVDAIDDGDIPPWY